MNGRKEKRSRQKLRVLLSNEEEPVTQAYALTENVSANGMRAITDQPRKLDTRVLIKSSIGELWARVIYCQRLPAHTFALGLELLSPTKSMGVGNLQSKRPQLRQKQDAVRFQTTTTELDLAITFYLVAAATKDQNRSYRAIANAEQAYAVAASSLDCNLKAGQNLEIEEKLIRLNSVRAGCPRNALFLSQ